MGVSHLLVFISVLSLTTIIQPSSAVTTEIFYPFGSAAGDTQTLVNYTESFVSVVLSRPFLFFGRTYNQIYVNNNGLLSFSQAKPEADPFPFPFYGSEDLIAPLWTELDDYGLDAFYYQQYTNGSILTRATQDINLYFPCLNFSASWVFVATWYMNVSQSSLALLVQAVLISDGSFSFILMNYGDISLNVNQPVEAGYGTINSTHYFVIPGSNNGSFIPNLKNTSNVNTPGRWAFSVNTVPYIFYTFGSAAGDTNLMPSDDGSSSNIELINPFMFFGHTYQKIYVNNNGHLTFNHPSGQFVPYSFPANESEDVIAALWTDLDSRGRGVVSYQQYTNGSTLTRATQDINLHFPDLTFTATWVFVATWNRVAYFSLTNTETSFQVVLISGGNFSFILMNYGDIAVTEHRVQAGYDTVNSTNYFVIPGSNDGSSIPNLKSFSNVNVPGRWVFRVNGEPRQNNVPKDKVIGFQMRLTSSLDLTDNDIKIILQKIKQKMDGFGLPSTMELNLKFVKKTKA